MVRNTAETLAHLAVKSHPFISVANTVLVVEASSTSRTWKAINPIDIVATKIGRLDQRTIQDIEVCIEEFKLSKTQVKERANQTCVLAIRNVQCS